VSSTKPGRNDPCPCGSGRKYKQCCLSTRNAALGSAVPAVDMAQLLREGLALFRAGRLDEAEIACGLLRGIAADDADVLQLNGLVLHARGRHDEALASLDRALTQRTDANLLSNRGVVLRSIGRLDEAIESFRAAFARAPADTMFLSNLGVTLRAAGRWMECIEIYDRLLALEPRNLEAMNVIGYGRYQLGDLDDYEYWVRNALAIDPRHGVSLANLAQIQLLRDDPCCALATSLAATAVAPTNAVAWENLGTTYVMLGRGDEARDAFARAFALQPSVTNRLRRDLVLSYIPASRAEIEHNRTAYERHIDILIRERPVGASECAALYFAACSFILAYHGENDVHLMRKLARMYCALCPSLEYRAAHVDRPRTPGARLRIGFFSVHTHQHSVSRCFAPLIAQLAKDARFEVVMISVRDPAKETVNPYRDFNGRLLLVSRDCQGARETIATERLDVLVYQDIGMEELSYFLAFARLARVQCVLGGHPDTTGIPNLDYFISTALAEPPEAQAHYSEKLLLISCLPAVFERPASPRAPARRADFGLPASGAIYLCPMMLHKLHPDFDAAIAGILERDPHGHVVLFRHYSARWEEALGARLDAALPAAARVRVLFLPWIRDYADFIRINALADVVIDPFHFGIGSTAAATFAVGTPLVTRPGEFLRGRVGLALCTLLELPECVTHSLAEYVARAVAIAHDAALRERLRTRILANNARLYDDRKPVRELADLFARIAVTKPEHLDVA
jgi:predicted O-linked N-acetylglucosamine transferase (SPINDLY family)